jgi:hypothetical protein
MPEEIAALTNRLAALEKVLAIALENGNANSRALIVALARVDQLESQLAACVALLEPNTPDSPRTARH